MNKIQFVIDNPNDFVRMWNKYVQQYGFISLWDVNGLLFQEYDNTDVKYGWTNKISVKDNFEIIYYKNYIRFKLNLPEPKLIKD